MRTKSKIVRQKPPADFEEVRRRFIRQNRELAKNNSNQSLRIRSLELEVSRLLADNLELRNQTLQLQNEVYTAQSRASTNAVAKIKQDLQAKLAELSGLVDGIEDAQEAIGRPAREKKPIEGNWRERQPLSELMRDSQMPTITEDKSYPRRTLGADEIQAIRLSDHSSNESPDLGPPPVAHFEDDDLLKNASPLRNKKSPNGAANEESDMLPANLSVNLETRRRRKDGQPKLEIRRHSIVPQEPVKAEGEAHSILRTGAKRKLSDRESEKPIKPPSKGDFTFSRKVNGEEIKTSKDDASLHTAKASTPAEAHLQAPASPKPARKVLGDKSVNMSPRKVTTKNDKPTSDKPEKPIATSKETGSTRRRRTSAIPLPTPQDEVVEPVEIPPPDYPPQTPALEDLFSPATSEPSARPEGGRGDTPPPGDLSTLSITTDGGTRPSRRARSAVNYTEPSLILKMRRPDKKMMDAVTGLQDPRRTMNASTEKGGSAIAVKIEEDNNDAWKHLPPSNRIEASSPLNQKSTVEPPPMLDEIVVSPPKSQPSTSSATISALMAGGRKRRESSQRSVEEGMNMDAAAKKLEELDLYDFKESSSPDDGGVKPVNAVVARSHRRHSSVSKDVGFSTGAADHVVEKEKLSVEKFKGSERVANRRRSMML